MSKIYDFKNKDIKIEFNSIKIGNSAYINQPIEVIEYIEYLQNQLQQKEKNNKKALEYLEHIDANYWNLGHKYNVHFDELLEILDKEVN